MIRAAQTFGVKKMTFDSKEELLKIKEHFPKAECVLRLASKNSKALHNLSLKFGADMLDVPDILE